MPTIQPPSLLTRWSIFIGMSIAVLLVFDVFDMFEFYEPQDLLPPKVSKVSKVIDGTARLKQILGDNANIRTLYFEIYGWTNKPVYSDEFRRFLINIRGFDYFKDVPWGYSRQKSDDP